eukprot:4567705-Pleurochrysis_carterae.AAC.4
MRPKEEGRKEGVGRTDRQIDRQTNRQWGWGGVGSRPATDCLPTSPGPTPSRPEPQGPQHAPPA